MIKVDNCKSNRLSIRHYNGLDCNTRFIQIEHGLVVPVRSIVRILVAAQIHAKLRLNEWYK